MTTEQQASVDMAQEGPKFWAKFHAVAEEMKQAVGDSCQCGELAVQAMQGFHDAVNVHLGKEAKYPESLAGLAQFLQEAVRGEADNDCNCIAFQQFGKWWGRCFKAEGGEERFERAGQGFSSRAEARKAMRPWMDAWCERAAMVAPENTSRSTHNAGAPPVASPVSASQPPALLCQHTPDGPARLSQSYIDYLLYGAASAVGAAAGAALVNKLLTRTTSPEDTLKIVDDPKPSVYNPKTIEGDQAQVDLGTLLSELDAILSKPETLGLVDPKTQKVVRLPG